jgi:hypothetical protein
MCVHTVRFYTPNINEKLHAFNYLMSNPHITDAKTGKAEPFWDLEFVSWCNRMNGVSFGVFTFLWQCDKEIVYIDGKELESVEIKFNEDEMENILRQNKASDAGCGC